MKFGARTNGNILICGAGIAGQALAFCLRQHGFTPTLVERSPQFRGGGYMIDVWGTGYDIIERFNLLADTQKLAYPIDRLIFVDSCGRQIAGFGGELIRTTFRDRFFCIPRSDLARVLYEALGGQVEILYNTSVDLICDTAEGAFVTLSGGKMRRFDLVIGADGLRSWIRKWIFGAETQFEKYLGYYAASFIAPNYPCRIEIAHVSYARPGRQISRYALRNGDTAFLFVFAEPNPLKLGKSSSRAQKDILRDRFMGGAWETDDILARLELAEELYFDPVSQIRMPKWSRGRVALVGDAAYCPSLLAGEGAAFAMLGAYVLAGELHKADGEYIQGFSAYEARLKSFIRGKQTAAVGFAKVFVPKTELGLSLRNAVLTVLEIPAIGTGLAHRMFGTVFTLPEYTDVTCV